jgi:ketosteroid isomerase-like protein
MSQENVEIVRRLIEAWNRNEQDRVIGILDPGMVIDAARRRVNPKTYTGMQGIRRMVADREEVREEFRMERMRFWTLVIGSSRSAVGWARARAAGSRCSSL